MAKTFFIWVSKIMKSNKHNNSISLNKIIEFVPLNLTQTILELCVFPTFFVSNESIVYEILLNANFIN